MANVDVQIGGRPYSIACRDGEEEHLRGLARTVDRKAADAAAAVGNMGEARHLLFASLLMADELMEVREGSGLAAEPAAADPAVADALEQLADRVEQIAARLEQDAPAS